MSKRQSAESKGALEIALDYLERGWAPIPIPRGKKAPDEAGWQFLKITKHNIKQYFTGAMQNIGVQLGPKSNGLTDVDLDCPEARQLAPHFLPKTGAIFGRPGNPRSHHLYIVKDAPSKSLIKCASGKDTIIELRLGATTAGIQTVFPGSQHPSGELIEWVSDGEPASVPFSHLVTAVRKIAIGVLLMRAWPNRGRHDCALCVAGFLVRSNWTEDEIVDFIGTIAHEAGDDEVEDRERAARDTFARHDRGEPISGLPKLIEAIGDEVAKQIAKILEYHEADADANLERMNEQFCVLPIGGKARVLTFKKEPQQNGGFREVATFLPLPEFKALNDHIKMGAKVGQATLWLNNPLRRQYEGVTFLPSKGREVDGYLNLWRGFGIEPRPGDWSLMRRHILEVLANGVKAHADYIINWSAWSFQHPGTRAEVALVFRGGRGVGKGVWGRMMCTIFGQHGMQISSSEHLTGRFNAHFMDLAMLFADEAYWPGNKSVEGALKRMITEPTLTIERKGMDTFETNNALHVIMASNEEWVIPAGIDERRFAVFDTGTNHQQDEAYFSALYAEIENGGAAAMLYDLLKMDLANWHPRQDVPQTKALQDQKMRSLSAGDQWWFDLIDRGYLPCNIHDRNDPPNRAWSECLFKHARETVYELRYASDTRLGRELKARGCLNVRMTNKKRGWEFPSLGKARAAWDRKVGARDDWGDTKGEDWGQPGF